MGDKPTVFNYQNYEKLQREVERLKADNETLRRHVSNLSIRLRLSEADNEVLLEAER